MAKLVKVDGNVDASTEEKIKEAARLVFTRNGFVATKVRDIAAEADINLSLVNYYFRSKEKLFEIIMLETIEKLLSEMKVIINNENTSLNEKFGLIVSHYIDQLLNNPDFPLFIVNEIFSGSDKFATLLKNIKVFEGSSFSKQLIERSKDNKLTISPIHILMNMIGMIIFPFLGRRILQKGAEISDDGFRLLMEERKKLIPQWVGMMLNK